MLSNGVVVDLVFPLRLVFIIITSVLVILFFVFKSNVSNLFLRTRSSVLSVVVVLLDLATLPPAHVISLTRETALRTPVASVLQFVVLSRFMHVCCCLGQPPACSRESFFLFVPIANALLFHSITTFYYLFVAGIEFEKSPKHCSRAYAHPPLSRWTKSSLCFDVRRPRGRIKAPLPL